MYHPVRQVCNPATTEHGDLSPVSVGGITVTPWPTNGQALLVHHWVPHLVVQELVAQKRASLHGHPAKALLPDQHHTHLSAAWMAERRLYYEAQTGPLEIIKISFVTVVVPSHFVRGWGLGKCPLPSQQDGVLAAPPDQPNKEAHLSLHCGHRIGMDDIHCPTQGLTTACPTTWPNYSTCLCAKAAWALSYSLIIR